MKTYTVEANEDGTYITNVNIIANTAREAVYETLGDTLHRFFVGSKFRVWENTADMNPDTERFFEMTETGKLLVSTRPLEHTLSL